MAVTSITVQVREGTIVYIPPIREGVEGRWRLIPANGKGTRPVPRRFLAKEKADG